MREKFFSITIILLIVIGLMAWTPNVWPGESVTWEILSSNMPTARSGLIAAVVGADIYTLGGHRGSDTYSDERSMRENEVYHTLINSWEEMEFIPSYRGCYGFATAVVNNKIFMFGGANPSGTGHYSYINLYDIDSNTWTVDISLLPYPVASPTAVVYDGYIYIFGGKSGAESGSEQPYRKIAIKFDPNTYEFTYLAELPYYRESGKAIVINDLIYLIGGTTATQADLPYGILDNTPVIDVYNPSENEWLPPKGEVPNSGNPILICGTIFLISEDLSTVYKYDVLNDIWSEVENTFNNTVGLQDHACFGVVSSKIYVLGGSSGGDERLDTVIEGRYQHTLIIALATGGTTDPPPGNYLYDCGTDVYITPEPDIHYEFSHWIGDVRSGDESDNPLSIPMNLDKWIKPIFLRIIYQPLNFFGQSVTNRSLLQVEFINILSWQANPNSVNIINYRIYQLEGQNKVLLSELNVDTFEYWHWKVDRDQQYNYAICAVNNELREGVFSYFNIREGLKKTRDTQVSKTYTIKNDHKSGKLRDDTQDTYKLRGMLQNREIFPPLQFEGKKVFNSFLYQIKYQIVLNWKVNPKNINIEKYRIYQVEGKSKSLLVELNAKSSKFIHGEVENNKKYIYALVAVNSKNQEGIPSYIEVK